MLIWLLLLVIEGFWLYQFIDCWRYQKENRLSWITAMLLLNIIAALYYWRIKALNSMSQIEFDTKLENWISDNGFSASKSKELLESNVQVAKKYFGLVIAINILAAFVDYVHLPSYFSWVFSSAMLGFLLWLSIAITKTWWFQKDIIIPFLADFIELAKDGKSGRKLVLGKLPKDPIADKAIVNLVMADFFLFVSIPFGFGGILFAIENISKGKPLFAMVILIAASLVALMFAFIFFQINFKVLFYYKPDYIFTLLKSYKLWKLLIYLALMLFTVGMGIVFSLLPLAQ